MALLFANSHVWCTSWFMFEKAASWSAELNAKWFSCYLCATFCPAWMKCSSGLIMPLLLVMRLYDFCFTVVCYETAGSDASAQPDSCLGNYQVGMLSWILNGSPVACVQPFVLLGWKFRFNSGIVMRLQVLVTLHILIHVWESASWSAKLNSEWLSCCLSTKCKLGLHCSWNVMIEAPSPIGCTRVIYLPKNGCFTKQDSNNRSN